MWLAPWFLLGLAGVALPIWLHRFARQTEEKRPFASAMFLEASLIRRSRRHELRYWLLLALRVLLLVLLALAFAGPLWRSSIQAGAGGATLHAIVLDTSLSMQQRGAWERAQEQALALIGNVKGADRAMLVAADHRLRVLQEPVFAAEAGRLRAAVQTLAPGNSRLDYGALVAGSAAWGVGPGERLLVHVVSDMQQSASPLRFADLAPPPGVTFDLVDVGAEAAKDLRVTGIQEDPREGGTLRVTVDGDAEAVAGRTLEIEVNGAVRERRALRAATLPAVERFVLGEFGPGEHRVTARLTPGDDLAGDDGYFALLRHVEPKVLVVAAATDGDDARYLGAALGSLAQPRFAVETAAPAALATRQLGDFAAIVVSDVGLLNDAAAAALKSYVEAGGAALLTLGSRAAQLSQLPVSGAKLARGSARAAANQEARVAELEQSHAILREPGAWRQIRFFRHVALEVPDDAQVLMRFTSGSPLMLQQSPGKGRLLVFASPLDRQWNDLAIHPLFVRFVAEATAWLADARAESAIATVGTALDANALRRGGAQVFDPAGKRVAMLGGAEEAGLRFLPEMPGFYELRGGGRSDFIAVNVDPREVRLARQDAAARERWLALQPQPGAPQQAVAGASATERLVPVWFWLLLAAVVLAFMEPLVANYHLNVRRELSA